LPPSLPAGQQQKDDRACEGGSQSNQDALPRWTIIASKSCDERHGREKGRACECRTPHAAQSRSAAISVFPFMYLDGMAE
jgi:hypothetical protein